MKQSGNTQNIFEVFYFNVLIACPGRAISFAFIHCTVKVYWIHFYLSCLAYKSKHIIKIRPKVYYSLTGNL